MTARQVLLWRHGRTTWNVERRFQGQADPPLDSVGRLQAREAAALLASFQPLSIVSSDLVRAADTAAPLASLTGVPVRFDPRLRERGLGRWEGLTRDEVGRLYPQEYADWLAGREDCQAGSEPREALAARAVAALADVSVAQTVVLVTHSATAIALTGRLLGMPVAGWRAVGPLANCHWSELQLDDHGWRLRAHNVGPAGLVIPQPVAGSDGGEEPPDADAEALDAGPPSADVDALDAGRLSSRRGVPDGASAAAFASGANARAG